MKDIFVVSIKTSIAIVHDHDARLDVSVVTRTSSVIRVYEDHRIQTLHKHQNGASFFLVDCNASDLYTPLRLHSKAMQASHGSELGETFQQNSIEESIRPYDAFKLSIESALQSFVQGGEPSVSKALDLMKPCTNKDEAIPMTLELSKVNHGLVDEKQITNLIQGALLEAWQKHQ